MGMLISRRGDEGWFCSMDEEWAIKSIEETNKLIEYLMDNMIPFRVTYSDLIHIHFEKSIYKQKDFQEFNIVVNKIMSYKEAYGNWKSFAQLYDGIKTK